MQCTAALVNRESFSIETTFSGNTERVLIATAKASGYEVTMTYIALNDVAKNVWPVEKAGSVGPRLRRPSPHSRVYRR